MSAKQELVSEAHTVRVYIHLYIASVIHLREGVHNLMSQCHFCGVFLKVFPNTYVIMIDHAVLI